MTIAITIVLVVVLAIAAYKVGERGAKYGVALFIVGMLGIAYVMGGTEMLFGTGPCGRYSSIAEEDC